MKKERIIYAAWLLLIACLYFFENNTGTRVVLVCTLLFPLLFVLRAAVPDQADTGPKTAPGQQTISRFVRRESDEPGDVRLYRPGDPVRRIHWKLSAKKGDILVREMQAEEVAAEEPVSVPITAGKAIDFRKVMIWSLSAVILICLILLMLIPDARRGGQALCNRLFAASEAVNAYAYIYFPVPEHQGVFPAVMLLILPALSIAGLAVYLRNRLLVLGMIAFLTLFQVYFGLSLPTWVNIPVYGLLAVLLMKHPSAGRLKMLAALILAVSVFCLILYPGVDAATESASEAVRDRLSRMVQQLTGTVSEMPAGDTETRHVHTQTLETGDRAASTDKAYRLVTVEEEQVSMPHWVNYVKIILLLLLAAALVILPFAPFLVLNSRKKKADEARKAFLSADVSEAVCAIFQQVITWLETTDNGAGNRLYRNWAEDLPDSLPEGYAARFADCAADFEEAAYSGHTLPEEKRERALDLLQETEEALWKKADRKQRFRLKYWMCLYG